MFSLIQQIIELIFTSIASGIAIALDIVSKFILEPFMIRDVTDSGEGFFAAMDAYFPFLLYARPVLLTMGITIAVLLFVLDLMRHTVPSLVENESPIMSIWRFIVATLFVFGSYSIIAFFLNVGAYFVQEMWAFGMPDELPDYFSSIVSGDTPFSDLYNLSEHSLSDILGLELMGMTTTHIPGINFIIALLLLLFFFAIAWNYFKLLIEVVERHVTLFILALTAPIFVPFITSKKTERVFSSFWQMIVSQLILSVLIIWFIRGINSAIAVAIMPSGGTAGTVGMFFDPTTGEVVGNSVAMAAAILALMLVAQKFDDHINRMGLSTANTGGHVMMELAIAGRSVMGGLRTATSAVSAGKGMIASRQRAMSTSRMVPPKNQARALDKAYGGAMWDNLNGGKFGREARQVAEHSRNGRKWHTVSGIGHNGKPYTLHLNSPDHKSGGMRLPGSGAYAVATGEGASGFYNIGHLSGSLGTSNYTDAFGNLRESTHAERALSFADDTSGFSYDPTSEKSYGKQLAEYRESQISAYMENEGLSQEATEMNDRTKDIFNSFGESNIERGLQVDGEMPGTSYLYGINDESGDIVGYTAYTTSLYDADSLSTEMAGSTMEYDGSEHFIAPIANISGDNDLEMSCDLGFVPEPNKDPIFSQFEDQGDGRWIAVQTTQNQDGNMKEEYVAFLDATRYEPSGRNYEVLTSRSSGQNLYKVPAQIDPLREDEKVFKISGKKRHH